MQFNIPAEHKNASGVYIIRNSVNAKVYVGSAVNFTKRFRAHSSLLNKSKHHSRSLQNFVNKYGVNCLVFDLLEVTEAVLAVVCEQRWINHFASSVPENGFNIAPTAGSCLGMKHTPETRAKVSAALRGRPVSDRTIAALRERNKNRIYSDEQRQKLSEVAKTRGAKPETRIKLSEAAKRQMQEGRSVNFVASTKNKSPETRARMSEAQKGRVLTEERREVLRKGNAKSNSRRVHSPETRAKIGAANTGKKPSEEARKRMSEAQSKRQPASPETRAKLSASLKGKLPSEETKKKLSEAKKGKPGWKWTPEQIALRTITYKATLAAKAIKSQLELF